MDKPVKARKRPIEIEAIHWTGENASAVQMFAGSAWDGPEGSYHAEIWDELHATWIAVNRNDWIIKGTEGEFYPCVDEVFKKAYEVVS